ncbi:glycosyltransferase [Streptomyces sp. NPDC050617]|uniref:glycosyltransferase n=1 Tax=Streptomyces sp. NPDC050617 TaxID=3154628 RepID=UPI00343356D8
MKLVEVGSEDPAKLRPVLGAERTRTLKEALRDAGTALAGRTVWQVNTTAAGGGVAELSHALLPYVRGAGIDVRWLVLTADSQFVDTAKRLCLLLYGLDVAEPDDAAHAHYTEVCETAAARLAAALRPGDVVILHDPQTAGLAPVLHRAGAHVVWRCHIGADAPTTGSTRVRERLHPSLTAADLLVFSTRRHIPAPWRNMPERTRVIPPSLDPLSVKNRDMDADTAARILGGSGLLASAAGASPLRISRITDGPPIPAQAPLVAQVSRWDPLKDMRGVMDAFRAALGDPGADGAHLLLAGPDVTAVADDPGGAAVLRDCHEGWSRLSARDRERVHLVTIPMDDPVANATVVAAIQRHAAVVVQKSLAEGFGLTVTEAMWKARPVVATAVGGIVDQISDEHEGILVPDPHDHAAVARHLVRLLTAPALAARLGTAARERVHRDFLPDRHLGQWAAALHHLVAS